MTDEPKSGATRPIVVAAGWEQHHELIEMVIQPDQLSRFAIWDGERVDVAESVVNPNGKPVVPYSATNNLIAHRVVLFPSEAAPYDSIDALLALVRSFIHRYADVSSIFEEVAGFYVLLSWIYDAFPEVPYLRLKGDFGSGKSRCLQTIGSLCYKPMFASGASTISPLFRIIDAFRGTLVIDEGDFRFSDERAELVKILNNGNAAGFPVLRSDPTPNKEFNPRAFNVFGPKIIATRRLFDDRALESRCITETMTGLPPRPDIPISLPASFHDEALHLRNQLLMYRFLNLRLPRDMDRATSPDIEPRVSQVFGSVLSLVDDIDARARILGLAHATSRAIRAERGTSLEAQLVDILRTLLSSDRPLSVKEIAEEFAERHGADYRRTITPKWIGGQLRSRLSLVAIKSNGVFLVQRNDPRLTSLFERYVAEDLGTSQATADNSAVE